MSFLDEECKVFEKDLKVVEIEGNEVVVVVFIEMIVEMEKVIGKLVFDEDGELIM